MGVTKITIPTQMYLGMLWRENEVPLGFLTPDGTDSGALKRKQTVDNWVRSNQQHRSKIPIDKTTIKNELLSGFKLSNSTRRWTTQNVVWRVIDPRGFEIEISSENLMTLMSDTTIIRGEILGKLIYGRTAGSNVLLHENSEEYIDAMKMTEVVSSVISIKDIKPGYEVSLHNGMELQYFGYYHTIVHTSLKTSVDNTNPEMDTIRVSDRKTHVFCDKYKHKIVIITSPKVGKITSKSVEFTPSQAIVLLSDMMTKEFYGIDSTGGYSHYDVIGFTPNKKANLSFSYEPVTIEYVEEIYKKSNKLGNYRYNNLYALSDDKAYTCSYYHDSFGINHKKNADTPRWDETIIDNQALTYTYITDVAKSNSFYSRNSYHTRRKVSWPKISDTIKSINFMKVVVDNEIKVEFYIH